MQFFSGFCLSGEESLFDAFLPMEGAFVAGFSYGSISAVRYALEHDDIKRVLLLSPAYYTHKDDEFKKTQLAAFENDKELYALKLLKKSGLSAEEGTRYRHLGTKEQLDELLFFDWNKAGLESLINRSVQIEVFIGAADRVVEPLASKEFFEKFAKVYMFDNKNHVLR